MPHARYLLLRNEQSRRRDFYFARRYIGDTRATHISRIRIAQFRSCYCYVTITAVRKGKKVKAKEPVSRGARGRILRIFSRDPGFREEFCLRICCGRIIRATPRFLINKSSHKQSPVNLQGRDFSQLIRRVSYSTADNGRASSSHLIPHSRADV